MTLCVNSNSAVHLIMVIDVYTLFGSCCLYAAGAYCSTSIHVYTHIRAWHTLSLFASFFTVPSLFFDLHHWLYVMIPSRCLITVGFIKIRRSIPVNDIRLCINRKIPTSSSASYYFRVPLCKFYIASKIITADWTVPINSFIRTYVYRFGRTY